MLDLHGVPQVTTNLYRPQKSGVPNAPPPRRTRAWFIVALRETGTTELRHRNLTIRLAKLAKQSNLIRGNGRSFREVSIAVFYLARRAEGFFKFETFAASYRRHAAGIDHNLIIVAKGFDRSELITLSKIFDGIPHQTICLDDEIGFDLHAYILAAGLVESSVVCFLNTHTRLRADDWLLKLCNGLQSGGVGLVGAFGSYQSLANRRIQKWRSLRCVMAATRALRLVQAKTDGFPHFPNPHIRTNVFLLRRDVFLSMPVPEKTKRSCFLFESGADGLTATVRKQRLKAVAVGANGRVYGELDWPSSRGFRLKSQSNLLAEDNMTDLFRDASGGHRRFLSKRAWGLRRWF